MDTWSLVYSAGISWPMNVKLTLKNKRELLVKLMTYLLNKTDKRSIVLLLDNGLAWLKDEAKEQNKGIESLWKEFRELEKVLYGEGSFLLSTTNKVRFEKRMNTIRRMLEKL